MKKSLNKDILVQQNIKAGDDSVIEFNFDILST